MVTVRVNGRQDGEREDGGDKEVALPNEVAHSVVVEPAQKAV